MTATLADSLRLVVPHLSPALVPERSLPRLEATAKQLPAIVHAGFECRLAEGEPQIDFQQGIRLDEGDCGLLHAFLADKAAFSNRGSSAEWRQRLGSLWDAWQAPSSPLFQCLRDLWLEFDLEERENSLAPPSVFIGLKRERLPAAEALEAIEIASATLRGAALDKQVLRNLARCFDACPPPALVTHVGLMMSRNTDALRINVSHLPPEAMSDFLRAAGWPHATAECESLAERLFDHCDKIRLCLDIGQQVSPRLGLECFFEDTRGLDFRWRPLLDTLVSLGLCAPAKREALLAWPGLVYPRNTPQAWPEHLLAASLCREDRALSVIDRQLSHIKVSFLPDRGCEAKAYFGFAHDWLGAEHDSIAHRATAGLPSRGIERLCDNAISPALAAGAEYLLRKQSQGGWWLDYFKAPAHASDEWVTAFAAMALATLDEPHLRPAIERAWRRLAARQATRIGWGWSELSPADSDSTAWALRLAKLIGAEPSEPLQHAREFMARHLRPCGGMTCYDERHFRETTGNWGRPLDGWSQTHACVTAAAAWIDGFAKPACRFLRYAQQEDGRWKAYWWEDDEYATALAVEALAEFGSANDHPRIERAMQWTARRIETDGSVLSRFNRSPSPHAMALCVRALALGEAMQLAGPEAERCQDRAIAWLLAQQNDDGSWPASAWVRVPSHHVVAPEESRSQTALLLDTRRVITTAAALMALHTAQAARTLTSMRRATRTYDPFSDSL